VQVPTTGVAQLWHGPEQALAQQTPSAQNPLAHWLLPAHAAPTSSFGTQAGAAQKKAGAQAASFAQLCAQVNPAQA
jgi:hypothetical protein